MIRRILTTLAVTLVAAAPLAAQLGSHNPEPGPRETVAIRGARIVPVVGEVIPVGTVVIADGRIQAVGATVTIPTGARIIDGAGLSVYPGMMDAGTSMGLAEITQGAAGTVDNSETGNWNPNVQAIWGIDPHSAHVGVTRVAGVTHVISHPSGSILAGQAALINLAGYTAPAMAVVPRIASVLELPGAGGRGGRGGFGGGGAAATPASGMTPLDSLKQLLEDARAYAKAVAAHAADPSLPRPTTDLALASLGPVLAGEMPVLIPANSESQIKEAVAFAEEQKLRPIIMGGRDAWRIAAYLVEHKVPVIYENTLGFPTYEDDGYDAAYAAPARMREAGVTFAIGSGEPNPDVRNLPYHAGMAASFGLSPEDALRAVTLWPAQIFGVGDRLGSLEPGKIANVVVTDGDILEARTSTRYLFIDGRDVPLGTRHTDLYDIFKVRK
ncbi:MAG: amidohydrolase family protein [Gemmatimonadales bacterium]|nr:amidohydrolase family protein [Gemmatimonadota bacterium]MCB9504526.1 amidohydrolase family protein [Gemmatimonadales bacterium]MCB9518099.1 amidohydrolase family protein [Gemmatimonadales bacterium]